MTKTKIRVSKKLRNRFAPKVMIGVPTYDAKNYCLPQFLHNISQFEYPRDRIELFIADNSKDNKNALMINEKYNIKTFWKDYQDMGVMEKLADTHNQIRRYFLESDCEYLLHLESDVFPPPDVIQQLLWARKPVVNALYHMGDASMRSLCIKLDDNSFSSKIISSFKSVGGFHHDWIQGSIQPTYIAGIGCCLMKKKVMDAFEFRANPNQGHPPDTYFADDLRAKKVQNYVHTGVLCFHWNRECWGRHHEYMEYKKGIEN